MATPITVQIRWASNVNDLKQQIAGGTGSIVAMKDAVEKTSRSLGGEGLLRAAHNTTAAVQQLGGATKLTAAEKERINLQLTKAIEKYQQLGQQAPKAMLDLQQATQKVTPQLTLADKAAGLLQSTFGQFTMANLASSAIQTVIGRVSEFVAVGMKLPAVEAAFGRLAGGLKQNAGDMLSSLSKATGGMVSNYDLMLSANKAMLLGLPVTAESRGELAAAATTLGRAMGKDATSSVDDLITALGRSSPMILDNLGLTVKVGEANDAYAETLGKSADALSDAEKKMAFYVAAMDAARRKTDELGEHTKTLSELATTAWTAVGNVISETAATLNVSIGHAVSSGGRFATFLTDVALKGPVAAVAMTRLNAEVEGMWHRTTAAVPQVAKTTAAVASFADQLAKTHQRVSDLTTSHRAD